MATEVAERVELQDESSDPPTPARLQLVLLASVVAVLRFAFAHDRTMFIAVPDEPATLAMARYLSGGTKWDMFINGTWRPGLATVLSPLFLLVDSQEWIIRLSLVVGAVAGGAGAWVMAEMTPRLAGLRPTPALVAVGAVAVLPAALVASAHVWAEPFVTLTFLCTLRATLRFIDRTTVGAGLTAIALSVLGLTFHSRLLVLVGITTAVVVARLALEHRYRASAGAFVFAAGLVFLANLYANWFYAALWTDPGDTNTVGSTLSRLSDPSAVLTAALGQGWYLLAASAGLVAIGVTVLIVRSLGRQHLAALHPTTSDARVVLLLTSAMVATSIVFMSGRSDRIDMLVYGRYNEAVIWPVLLVAIGWLSSTSSTTELRAASRWRLPILSVVALASSGVATQLVYGDDLIGYTWNREMVAGVVALNNATVEIRVLAISLASAAIAVAMWLVYCYHRRLAGVFAVLLVAVLGIATRAIVEPGENALARADNVRSIDEIVPEAAPVTFLYDTDLEARPRYAVQLYYAHAYQWFLPEHEFTLAFEAPLQPGDLVFAPENARALIGRSATIVWNDGPSGMSLWKVD